MRELYKVTAALTRIKKRIQSKFTKIGQNLKLIPHDCPRKDNAAKMLETEGPKMLKNIISMVHLIKIRLLTLEECLLCNKMGNDRENVLLFGGLTSTLRRST